MNLGLQDKFVLITGSNRGTGAIIARRFADEGARVVVHSLREGESTVVASTLPRSHAVWGDLTDDAGAEQVLAQCKELGLGISILVNNYGTASGGSWQESSSADWVRLYEQNTLSAVRMIRLFTPYLPRPAGRIINIGTIGSTRPGANMPHYYAAKGALANMTVSLAKDLSGTGITVNLVSPGLIRTPEVESSFIRHAQRNAQPDDWASVEKSIVRDRFPNPVGRIATREEVADLVVFLASERAGFINGQNIRIDGGAVDIV